MHTPLIPNTATSLIRHGEKNEQNAWLSMIIGNKKLTGISSVYILSIKLDLLTADVNRIRSCSLMEKDLCIIAPILNESIFKQIK